MKPWKPKYGEVWFTIGFDTEGISHVFNDTWTNNDFCLRCYALGSCFHTKEEAEQYKDKYVVWLNNKEPDVSWRK